MTRINHTLFLLTTFLYSSIFLISCKKEEANVADNAKIEWMHVLDENLSGSTEDDRLMGQNGKVLTDEYNNIYLYYFSELPVKSVVIKCDPSGAIIWKSEMNDCIPLDMVLKADGHLALAVSNLPGFEKVVVIFDFDQNGNRTQHKVTQTGQGGSFGVLSASMYAMPDNSIVMSGVYLSQFLIGFPLSHEGYFLQLDGSYTKVWNFITAFSISTGTPLYEQTSIVPVSPGRFLAQLSYQGDQIQFDSLNYGYITLIANAAIENADTSFNYPTGYFKQSTVEYAGYYNKYSRGIIKDGTGYIHHFSAPSPTFPGAPLNTPVTNGFIKIGDDGAIKDTIPFAMPEGYRIISCNKGADGFLMTAYKTGAIDVAGDFSANQTLFLIGNNNWQVTSTFKFQEFYSDFFPSAAPTTDGGYVIMGKVQSFNGPQNKLILIKWKNNY